VSSLQLITFGSAFVGSAVESVEALTIVLAVGLTRGWRAPLEGTVLALLLLAAVVIVFGQAVTTYVPESVLRLVIGTLVLLFGLRWLQKAVRRSAGLISFHNEDKEFSSVVDELQQAGDENSRDWVGLVVAFKGVLLEGFEVAFIVFAVGSSAHDLGSAGLGAATAVVLVGGVGSFLRHPLARVPENVLKYTVGVMLTSLGTFWAAEGLGVVWPLDLGFVFVLAAIYVAVSQAVILLLRQGSEVTKTKRP
jgi:uncharacterized membrane protein